MHHLVALLAGCLLHPPADDPCREARAAQYEFLRNHGAQEVEWLANGTVRSMKVRGVFLRSGIEGLKVGQPAPEILEAIGPALLARGTEELRVRMMDRDISGDIVIKLDVFISGREVKWSHVNIVLNESTNEVTAVYATFMPDRGLDHEPRLSPDEAKAKAGTELRASLRQQLGGADAEVSFGDEAELAYEFEEAGTYVILGGALVWMFSVDVKPHGGGQVSVDAATGKIIRMYEPYF